MSRYETAHYSNRREYLNWLAEVYGVDRADVVLLSSILGTDQDFDGLPAALKGLAAMNLSHQYIPKHRSPNGDCANHHTTADTAPGPEAVRPH